jgi:type I restriction enzyme S subunit
MPQQLGDNRINLEGIARISEEDCTRLSRHIMEEGDIVFSRRGDVTRRAIITSQEAGYLCGTGCLLIRLKHPRIDNRFVSLFFSLPQFKEYIVQKAVGATMPNLNTGILKRIPLVMPVFETQKRIVDVLSAYDDLIENNRRRMVLLEESARLLYQEWFVRLRFPGHEHVRIVKGLPEGWKTGHFSEFVDYLEGPGLLNRQYRDEGIPFLNIRTIKDDDIDFTKVQYLQEGEVEAKYKHFLLAEDDHVVSSSGTLGRVVTIRACHIPVMLNTSLIRMRPRSYLSKWFIKAYLKHGDYADQVTSMATGAAQLNYGPSHLAKLHFKVPTPQLAALYDEFVAPCYTQIKTLLDVNLKLRTARDLLLPRLMSGEVAV